MGLMNSLFPPNAAIACCLALLLAACSNGEVMSPGGGGTGADESTIAIGPITGFGSFIVNGIRYDDSQATLKTETGATVMRSNLRLGMTVEVRGSASQTDGTGTADTVTIFSDVKGTIEALTRDGFVVSGLTVKLVDTTIYDNASSFKPGDFVEVYGAFDASNNSLIATRVERQSAGSFKLRGIVSEWNNLTEQFMLGALRIRYNGLTLPSGFENGASVRVYGSRSPVTGVWQVANIREARTKPGNATRRAEIKGIVTQYSSVANFTVNGLRTNAQVARFKDGVASDLAVGRWVQVKGKLQDGLLIADKVQFEDGMNSNERDEIEITGRITNFVSTEDFSVRNTSISVIDSTRFEGGTPADLANGVCIEVEGGTAVVAGGSVVQPTKVEFEDDCD